MSIKNRLQIETRIRHKIKIHVKYKNKSFPKGESVTFFGQFTKNIEKQLGFEFAQNLA